MKLFFNRKLIACALFSMFFASFVPLVYASDAEHSEHGPQWGLGLFLGAAEAHSEWEPTAGIELEYRITHQWAVAALWEQTDGDNDPTLWMALLGFRPHEKIGLQVGAGRHEVGEHSENAYRLAVDYEFLLAPTWFLKPYAAYDFIEHAEDEPVLGFYVGKFF